jgi:hypothetical protein
VIEFLLFPPILNYLVFLTMTEAKQLKIEVEDEEILNNRIVQVAGERCEASKKLIEELTSTLTKARSVIAKQNSEILTLNRRLERRIHKRKEEQSIDTQTEEIPIAQIQNSPILLPIVPPPTLTPHLPQAQTAAANPIYCTLAKPQPIPGQMISVPTTASLQVPNLPQNWARFYDQYNFQSYMAAMQMAQQVPPQMPPPLQFHPILPKPDRYKV